VSGALYSYVDPKNATNGIGMCVRERESVCVCASWACVCVVLFIRMLILKMAPMELVCVCVKESVYCVCVRERESVCVCDSWARLCVVLSICMLIPKKPSMVVFQGEIWCSFSKRFLSLRALYLDTTQKREPLCEGGFFRFNSDGYFVCCK